MFTKCLKPLDLTGRGGTAEAGAVARTGTETGVDATAHAPGPVQGTAPATGTGRETGRETGTEITARSTRLAGLTAPLAPVETETESEMWTSTLKTAGRTNMSTDHLRRSLLWGTSTTAKSPASCSLAALSSWRA